MSFDEGKITFQEADRRYAKLRREQESGSLSNEEFDAELKQLMVQDPEGRWWAKSPTTGEWHYHDGTAWVKGTPPGYQVPQAAPEDQPETQQSESVEAQESARRVAALYAEAQRHADAEEWQQALECFEEAQRLEPGYRDTEELLERVRQELASPTKVEVPDLSGQTLSQARSTLVDIGLKPGRHSEITNDKMPKGQIISQSPEAATDLETGKLVSVTVSSGPRSDVAFGTLRVRYTGIPAGLRGSLELFLDGEEVGNFSTRGQEIEVKSEAGSRSIMVRWLKGTRPILGLSTNVSNSPPLTFQMRSNDVLDFTCGVRVTWLMGARPFIEHSQTPSSESSSRPEQNIQPLLALLGFSRETPTIHEEPTPWLRNAIVTLLVIGAILFILLVSLYLL